MATRRRQRIIRERNEGGFRHFLVNLKSVFRVFLNPDNLQSIDDLIETKSRLLDAAGTLSLLRNDVENERGRTSTGLSIDAIEGPLQNLHQSTTSLIDILAIQIEEREGLHHQSDTHSFSAPVTTQLGPGRRRFEISRDQLEHLRSLFFSWKKNS